MEQMSLEPHRKRHVDHISRPVVVILVEVFDIVVVVVVELAMIVVAVVLAGASPIHRLRAHHFTRCLLYFRNVVVQDQPALLRGKEGGWVRGGHDAVVPF